MKLTQKLLANIIEPKWNVNMMVGKGIVNKAKNIIEPKWNVNTERGFNWSLSEC